MANKVKGKADVSQEQEANDAEEQAVGLLPFIEENQRLVVLVVGVLIILSAGFAGYRYLQTSKDAEAQEEMISAVSYFEADSLDKALNGDGTFLGFQDIVDEYSGTPAANMSRYYTGIIYARQGQTDLAIEYLEEVDGNGTLLDMAVYQALGYCYEELQAWEQAANSFERAATSPEESPLTPGLLLKAGENYEDAGETEQALEVYRKIKEEYPNTQEGNLVDKYIGRISE